MTDIIRAYSEIEFKAVDDVGGKRRFTGTASTITTDRGGDIVEPRGMQIKFPTPLLWQHSSWDPIGWVRAARVNDKGIDVDCEVADIDAADSQELKAEIDKRWAALKAGLVRGLSIGFKSIEAARIEGTYGYRYMKTELLELSTVTIPMNVECNVHTIKSADEAIRRAAQGNKASSGVVWLGSTPVPGVSGQDQRRKGVVYLNR